jgi:hypothetical protein
MHSRRRRRTRRRSNGRNVLAALAALELFNLPHDCVLADAAVDQFAACFAEEGGLAAGFFEGF